MSAAASRRTEEGFWALAGAAARKSFVFHGRARRTEVMAYSAACPLLGLGSVVLLMAAGPAFAPERAVLLAVGIISQVLMILPIPALLVRRGHDLGVDGRLPLALFGVLVAFSLAVEGRSLFQVLVAPLPSLLFIGFLVPVRAAADRFGPDRRLA
ncbi:DUF805 domain-containing protein [Sphingomonas humi]|uniref:DUF805 domain-containing protein n=1 Tax=Sphingomonas humi TaxID=335630 RepID=A0ABP7SCB6_9SPHN